MAYRTDEFTHQIHLHTRNQRNVCLFQAKEKRSEPKGDVFVQTFIYKKKD